jgi:hypothetical protein
MARPDESDAIELSQLAWERKARSLIADLQRTARYARAGRERANSEGIFALYMLEKHGLDPGPKKTPSPIPPDLFRRVWMSSPGLAGILGFYVRFPGIASDEEREWLKSHGYKYSGKDWFRMDRSTTKMTRDDLRAHHRKVRDRIRAKNIRLAKI